MSNVVEFPEEYRTLCSNCNKDLWLVRVNPHGVLRALRCANCDFVLSLSKPLQVVGKWDTVGKGEG